ncbi:parathyroid hormone 1a [Odontesthes bonariensis]|uniref:parathyroid hormone 1a n=1 Tax=Odontesthes bonariensis TaxID=219752 RepID=UPI003F5883E1
MRPEAHLFTFNRARRSQHQHRVNLPNMDYKIIFISLCVLHLSIHTKGRPLSKRTVSEMQLMHDVGQHKQVQERRDWLQMRLRGIHNAAARGGSAETEGWRRRKLSPEDLTELSDLTSEEIQHALDFLEKLLESKQS